MTVLNRQYNYLFIHVPKSAGKSVKQHLLRYTFSPPERAALRFSYSIESLCTYAGGFRGLRRFVPSLHGPAIDRRLRDYCDRQGYYTSAHLRADELIEILGDDYRKLFTFAFVRNPWDRCLSAYFYFQRKPLHPLHGTASRRSFPDFLQEQEADGMPFVGQQTLWLYREYRDRLVDFVGKVERIGEDMAAISSRLGLPGPDFSARTNVSEARERDYRSYYTDAAVDIVSRAMRSDIELLDYQFEQG